MWQKSVGLFPTSVLKGKAAVVALSFQFGRVSSLPGYTLLVNREKRVQGYTLSFLRKTLVWV